jgi:hypothetical protein
MIIGEKNRNSMRFGSTTTRKKENRNMTGIT